MARIMMIPIVRPWKLIFSFSGKLISISSHTSLLMFDYLILKMHIFGWERFFYLILLVLCHCYCVCFIKYINRNLCCSYCYQHYDYYNAMNSSNRNIKHKRIFIATRETGGVGRTINWLLGDQLLVKPSMCLESRRSN